MSAKSLAGLNILVTRPTPQHRELVSAIEASNGQALHLPLLAIDSLRGSAEVSAIKSKILELDRYEILIFVSANAVEFGVEWIERYWPQLPTPMELVAIGPSTAQLLSSRLAQKVVHAESGMTSEDLLRIPVLSNIANQRIGIVRGLGGRELLAATLRARGATVDYLEVYQRSVVPYQSSAFNEQIKANAINVLSVTSSESLDRLAVLLGDNKAQMSLLPLLVPSPRVAQRARDLGFQKLVDAGGADVESTMAALATLN